MQTPYKFGCFSFLRSRERVFFITSFQTILATRIRHGVTFATQYMIQPWPHSGRKNAAVLIGSRPTGLNCSQSQRPKGKLCWPTSRTPTLAHATPSEQPGARPSRQPAAAPMSTGITCAPTSKQLPTAATPRACMGYQNSDRPYLCQNSPA